MTMPRIEDRSSLVDSPRLLAMTPPELRTQPLHVRLLALLAMLLLAVLGVMFLLSAGATLLGCQPGQAATITRDGCLAVDAAHQACVLLRYMDEQGHEQTVQVPAAELHQLGRATAKRAQGVAPGSASAVVSAAPAASGAPR